MHVISELCKRKNCAMYLLVFVLCAKVGSKIGQVVSMRRMNHMYMYIHVSSHATILNIIIHDIVYIP